MSTTSYVVWRRHPDGHVNATVGRTAPPSSGAWSFEALLVTSDWDEALALIIAERKASGTGDEYGTRS